MTHLTLIIPCYNEEEVLCSSISSLMQISKEMQEKKICTTSFLLIDDGSSDHTWPLIQDFHTQHPNLIHALKLAHNVGHQRAIWAGLEWALNHADAAITIDADLQDDIHVIPEMMLKYKEGNDIVYGVRKERKTDTFFKRNSAQMYYKMVRGMGCDILYNHADFRLMSNRSIKALMQHPERNLFLRGMVYELGFPHDMVFYSRKKRTIGESKYPLNKMLALAIDGVTSFSVKPLRLIVYIGLSVLTLSILAIIFALIIYLTGHAKLPGWTSIIISIWFVGGAIITSLGVIGIYIGKIFQEVKRRPHYHIDKEL